VGLRGGPRPLVSLQNKKNKDIKRMEGQLVSFVQTNQARKLQKNWTARKKLRSNKPKRNTKRRRKRGRSGREEKEGGIVVTGLISVLLGCTTNFHKTFERRTEPKGTIKCEEAQKRCAERRTRRKTVVGARSSVGPPPKDTIEKTGREQG